MPRYDLWLFQTFTTTFARRSHPSSTHQSIHKLHDNVGENVLNRKLGNVTRSGKSIAGERNGIFSHGMICTISGRFLFIQSLSLLCFTLNNY